VKRYILMFFCVLIASWSALSLAADKASTATIFITGANRGIGLEFVRQYSDAGWKVIATARKPSEADDLQELAQTNSLVTIEQLDVTDHGRIDALAEQYKDQPIDILINNAAITPKYLSAFKGASGVDYDMARRSYEVNALGPLKISQAFMPQVEASQQKKIIVISSKAGSFAEGPQRSMMYSYRASKSALNMMMYTLAFETEKEGVTLTLLSPGTVNTMGVLGRMIPNAIQPQESVGNMIKLIAKLTVENNGKMYSHKDGALIAW
jgi:NAD(P)-dependent dehydrogenase (short-subunit alcohol dehydrogenase family)